MFLKSMLAQAMEETLAPEEDGVEFIDLNALVEERRELDRLQYELVDMQSAISDIYVIGAELHRAKEAGELTPAMTRYMVGQMRDIAQAKGVEPASLPAFESVDGLDHDLEVAMEGLGDMLSRLWDNVVVFVNKLKEGASKFFKGLFDRLEKLEARLKKQEAALKVAGEDLRRDEIPLRGGHHLVDYKAGTNLPTVEYFKSAMAEMVKLADLSLLRDSIEVSLDTFEDHESPSARKKLLAVQDQIIKHYDLAFDDKDSKDLDAAIIREVESFFNWHTMKSKVPFPGGLTFAVNAAQERDGETAKRVYLFGMAAMVESDPKKVASGNVAAPSQSVLIDINKELLDGVATIRNLRKEFDANIEAMDKYREEVRKLQRLPLWATLTALTLAAITAASNPTAPVALLVMVMAHRLFNPLAFMTANVMEHAISILNAGYVYCESGRINLK